MPVWMVFAVVGGLSSVSLNFLSRQYFKQKDSTAFLWWFKILKLTFFVILLFFDFWIELSLKNLIILTTFGLLEVYALYLFGRMHVLTDLSISSIVNRLRIVWVPLFAFLFLSERLSALEYLGVGLVFFGLAIVVSPKKLRLDQGVRLTFFFSLIAALLSVLMKAAAEVASTPVVMLFMDLPSLLLFPILMKSSSTRIKVAWQNQRRGIATFTFFSIISMYAITTAYRSGPASIVVSLYQGVAIVSVFLGIFVLKETEDLFKKLLGAVITLGGVLLLI